MRDITLRPILYISEPYSPGKLNYPAEHPGRHLQITRNTMP